MRSARVLTCLGSHGVLRITVNPCSTTWCSASRSPSSLSIMCAYSVDGTGDFGPSAVVVISLAFWSSDASE